MRTKDRNLFNGHNKLYRGHINWPNWLQDEIERMTNYNNYFSIIVKGVEYRYTFDEDCWHILNHRVEGSQSKYRRITKKTMIKELNDIRDKLCGYMACELL